MAPRSPFLLAVALCSAFCAPHSFCQAAPPDAITGPQSAQLLKDAAAKYYRVDPAIKSFTCNAQPNWDTLAWDKVVAPTLDPPSSYAALIAKLRQAAPMSFTFTIGHSFNGFAGLTIPDAPGITSDEQKMSDTIQGLYAQMLIQYLKFWGDLFNGEMIPGHPTSVRRTPDGYETHEAIDDPDIKGHNDLVLDSNLVLLSRDLLVNDNDIRMKPTFTPSPSGLLLTAASLDVSSPAFTAAGLTNDMSYTSTFAAVDTVLLPSGFKSVATITQSGKTGKLVIDMTFSACTLKKNQ